MIGKSSPVDMINNLLRQSEMRQRVISQNIANVNTPGYKSVELGFAEAMGVELGEDMEAVVQQTEGLVEREDGNNVNLEAEMAKLTKNSLEFETYSHLLVAKFSMLRSAINGQ
ncbi:MAG: flagellar biosynthesis protein FlgB [Planctomycetaceae bacterium]|nr:flagellar biosynthesis protein FlgB [Planctomycetaceae bacterium]MCP4464059.1 flagellar biosynthesis protein FlgB [Planctomycetaceae bacterium]MDG2103836.1 flagellar basal body protein [Pirellulaceae bacterium]